MLLKNLMQFDNYFGTFYVAATSLGSPAVTQVLKKYFASTKHISVYISGQKYLTKKAILKTFHLGSSLNEARTLVSEMNG